MSVISIVLGNKNVKTLGEIGWGIGPWALEISVLWMAGGGGRGEQHNLPIFTIQLFTLSLKDITRVISRGRDRLVEIRSNRLLSHSI